MVGIWTKTLGYSIPYIYFCFAKYDSLKAFAITAIIFSSTYFIDNIIFCFVDKSKGKKIITGILVTLQFIFVFVPCIILLAGEYKNFGFLLGKWDENGIRWISLSFIFTILTTVPTNRFICSKCLSDIEGGV